MKNYFAGFHLVAEFDSDFNGVLLSKYYLKEISFRENINKQNNEKLRGIFPCEIFTCGLMFTVTFKKFSTNEISVIYL